MAKKKKKKKNKGGSGPGMGTMVMADVIGDVLGNAVNAMLAAGVEKYLNKQGKKKLREWSKMLGIGGNGTSRGKSSKS